MWTCPACQRSFKRSSQPHSCVVISKNDLFSKRPEFLFNLYEAIVRQIKELEYREEAVPPDTLFFRTSGTFLAIKVKKAFLEVEFFLDHQTSQPEISRWLQTSRHRFAHVVTVDSEEQITGQLIHWIRSSYQLVTAGT